MFTGGLELRPIEGLSIRLRAGYEDTDQRDYPNRFATSNAVPAQPAGPAFPPAFQLAGGTVKAFDSFAVTPGYNDRQFATSSLTIDADISGHTLTAITGYTDLNFDTATDLDYEARRIRYQIQRVRQEEFSQELRFASPGDQPITYLAGAYYYQLRANTTIDDRIAEDAAPIAAAIPASLRRQLQGGAVNQLNERTDSFALFAQVAGHVGDRLTLTAEGRYTWETKRVNAVDIAQFGGTVGNFDDSAKFRNFVPRFTIDYKLDNDVLLYATAAKAVKVGGFNVVTVTGAILDNERTYRPERSWNYELGVKASALDGTLTANADLFLIKWDDQIVRALGGTLAVLNTNAGKTTSKGAELELHMRPTRGLDVSAGFAYTDARYDRYTFGALAQLGISPVLDGKPLQYVSKYTANAAIQYDRPLSGTVNWFGRADISLRSKQSAVQPANSFIGDAAIFNLRTGVSFGGLELRLFVDNVTKEKASPSAVYLPSAAARFDFVRGAIRAGPRVGFQAFGALVQSREPRTYGASLSYKF